MFHVSSAHAVICGESCGGGGGLDCAAEIDIYNDFTYDGTLKAYGQLKCSGADAGAIIQGEVCMQRWIPLNQGWETLYCWTKSGKTTVGLWADGSPPSVTCYRTSGNWTYRTYGQWNVISNGGSYLVGKVYSADIVVGCAPSST